MPSLVFPEHLLQTVGLVDLLDVALAGLLFYGLLLWLRQGTSSMVARRAIAIALVFAAAYFSARFLDLLLVQRLLQLLLIAYLLITVVVFQGDVRRMLNRFAPWRFLTRASPAATDGGLVDLLVESANHLAKTNTGALIVLKGEEPWDEHIHGGVTLDGIVSQPLLYSLFNPDTPGHDGAVLLEGKRISKFGVHLPLATDLPHASRYGGTRHAAALGLSQHCDALVLVVSEERGTVGVAQEGQLTELSAASELNGKLEAFLHKGLAGPAADKQPWWRWLNPPVALLSVTLAAVLWFFLVYSPNMVYRSLEVPIEFRNLPDGWELVATDTSTAQVTLAGPEQAFVLFDSRTLALSFDLAQPQEGDNLLVAHDGNLALPSRVRLYDVSPEQVRAEVSRLVPIEVPIAVQTVGFLPGSLSLVRLSPEPATFTLLVPQTEAQPLQRVVTQPIDLRSVTASTVIPSTLQLPEGWRLPDGVSPELTVRVEVQGH